MSRRNHYFKPGLRWSVWTKADIPMSRFGNLEFGDESEGEAFRGASGAVAKDESFYTAEAQAAFEQSDFDKSLRFYSKVIEHNVQNAAAWTGQVKALIEMGEFHEAKIWADKALERFPHEPELLAAKAVALARNGDLDGALAFSDASFEEQGDTPYIWLARGDVLLARKEKRAGYCFDKALLLAPGDWFIAWLAARIRYFYHEFTLALKHAQQALALNVGNSMLWVLAGMCQAELSMLAPARVSFTQALQLDPKCAAARMEITKLNNTGPAAKLRHWWQRLFHP
jgi:Flp pilus assembly protein TadD